MAVSPPAALARSMTVGVGGQLFAGKDCLSDHLAVALGRLTGGADWHRGAFAAAVKQTFIDAFAVDQEWVERWKRIDTPPPGFLKTVRQMLIDIGDGFRTFRADVWIDRVLRRPGYQVVSDARYLNEMAAIKAAGGVTVALWRPGHDNDNPNRSEQELRAYIQKFIDRGVRGATGDDLVDLFLVNDGGVADLFAQADRHAVPFVAARLAA